MKCLGLIHDSSPEAVVMYLRGFDEEVARHLGIPHPPRLIIHYANGHALETAITERNWSSVNRQAVLAGRQCVAAGAEAVVLGGSALHVTRESVADDLGVPVFDMVASAASAIARTGIKCVGLLGARFPNEARLWQECCATYGMLAAVPAPEAAARVTTIIREELNRGLVLNDSKNELIRICAEFRRTGSRVVVLATPELNLLLREADSALPLFDAAAAHVATAVAWATETSAPAG